MFSASEAGAPCLLANNGVLKKGKLLRTKMKRQRICDAPDREVKFFDSTFAALNVPLAGSAIQSPNLVGQGSTDSTRQGRQFRIIYFGLKGVVYLENSATVGNGADLVRLIVYLDKQANGALAGVTDVLTTTSIFSFYNPRNVDRFEILDDCVYSLTSPAFDATTGSVPTYKNVIKNYNLSVDVEAAATGVIASFKSNNIGFFWISFAGFAFAECQTEIQFLDS